MSYKCGFPGCSFKTVERDRIDRHHIIPRGKPRCTNNPSNLIWLCPDHHRAIYIPGETHGHHSIINKDSIVIIDRLDSSTGKVLRYRKCSDMVVRYYYYCSDMMEIEWKSVQLDLWDDPGNYYEL